jgi:uncharacterized membrane protein YfcA
VPQPGATLLTVVHLTAGRDVLLVLAGFGAGLFNGVAGGGTLISFPVLLALGYPALIANVTSTVGIWPGYLASAAGFRREIVEQRDRFRMLAPVTIVGATIGAILLLTTPSSAFTRLAPWLVLFASALFALGPFLTRWLADEESVMRTRPIALGTGMFFAALYGGYFGAAMGVIMLAVLGLTLPDTMARAGGIRTVLSVLANGVAAIVFIIHAHLQWGAAGLLAVGCLIGGYVGARVARKLPAPAFRVVVVAIGLATGIRLLVG